MKNKEQNLNNNKKLINQGNNIQDFIKAAEDSSEFSIYELNEIKAKKELNDEEEGTNIRYRTKKTLTPNHMSEKKGSVDKKNKTKK